jgi:transposase
VGAASHYLTNVSSFHHVGTTNLNAELLAALKKKTTHPPVVLSNVTFSANTNLAPQAARDTDVPDLGFHYDAIDFAMKEVAVTNATLTLTNGVSVALFGSKAMILRQNGKVVSEGAPLALNRLTQYQAVQEQPVAWGGTSFSSTLVDLASDVGTDVRLWVQDEMRYGLHGFTRRVWGLPGHRTVAPAQQVYQWGYVYGAVAMRLTRTQFLLAGSVDLATEIQFYRQVAQSDPAAMHLMIQDGAGFHLRDGDERLPDNLRIVTLPAYSPELNPVEGLWDQLKDVLCNRVYETLAELEAQIANWLREFWQDARRVRSIVFDWLQVSANASSMSIIPTL